MKKQSWRNLALVLVGLCALSIYILACSSFSPDDTKVLYPAFDKASGGVGLAVYDRESRQSDMLFLPLTFDGTTNATFKPAIMRGQWLADGRNILVAWATGDGAGSDVLHLALVPATGKGTFKTIDLPDMHDPGINFIVPLCVAGDRIFLRASEDQLIRLDLKTGDAAGHTFPNEISPYPDPAGRGLFYVESVKGDDKKAIFGRLNPDDFSRTALLTLTNNLADRSFFAYDQEGKHVAFVETNDKTNRLVVLSEGKVVFTRSLGERDNAASFSSAVLSPKGDTLWAAFQRKSSTNATAYGLMEIPLGSAPVREIKLLETEHTPDDMMSLYFQVALSHDGRTAALASTYLAFDEEKLAAENCALFLVDLGTPERKVTKVPIPLPSRPIAK